MSESSDLQLPPPSIWTHVSKLSLTEDKPIMLDYWMDSLNKDVIIGVKEDDEKLLVKNEEEYTSPIVKIFQIPDVKVFIICTENSIYITSSEIDRHKIE